MMSGKNSFCSEGIVFMKISKGVLRKENTSRIRRTALKMRIIMKALKMPLASF
jgi:hypothetical protein